MIQCSFSHAHIFHHNLRIVHLSCTKHLCCIKHFLPLLFALRKYLLFRATCCGLRTTFTFFHVQRVPFFLSIYLCNCVTYDNVHVYSIAMSTSLYMLSWCHDLKRCHVQQLQCLLHFTCCYGATIPALSHTTVFTSISLYILPECHTLAPLSGILIYSPYLQSPVNDVSMESSLIPDVSYWIISDATIASLILRDSQELLSSLTD